MKSSFVVSRVVPVLIFFAIASSGAAQEAARTRLAPANVKARIAELERTIPALMDSGAVTGLQIAIVADGKLAWARGFGVRSAETGAPVDEGTVFEAASLSKPVFAYGVLKLVDQGVIDLDTPLAQYWAYEDAAHDERYKKITARMVLSHTPGFPNWRPRGGQLSITFEPGSKFSYSGEGFVFLQRVVEHLTGEPLNVFMKRTVFDPLGMTRSSYVWEESFAANHAVPHRTDGAAMEKSFPEGSGNAAASLHTTASDFARFMVAVMKGTDLSEKSAQAMLAPQIEVDPGVSWGLGTGLEQTALGRGFWHWGHNDGYRAYTLAYRDSGDGVVWFTNSSNGMTILKALLDRAVGGKHPSLAWLDYEQYNAPPRAVRSTLERVIRTEGLEAGLARYHELKRSYPAEAFGENMLNTLGYRLMGADLMREAIAIFQLNIMMFPEAFNPYDSLGEAYMNNGDLELAAAYYKKSVELNPENTNGIRMLERIREELAEKETAKQN